MLVIAGILVFLIVLFFFWLSYSSPVNEAGRAYRKDVRSYQNVEIETMDDVFERLEVLDNHFNSATFDKVQGGEKREVTLADIETLFGSPHQVVEDVDIDYTDKVYQYHYDEITLNFHYSFRTIDELVIENFTNTLYNPDTLDQLFIDTIINHQTQFNSENEEFDPIFEEDIPQLVMNKTPTRKIRQSGWFMWSFTRQDFFDDGSGEYAPNEYLSLQFKEEKDDLTELYIMDRRFHEAYSKRDTKEEMENKKEAKYTFNDLFEQKESNNLDEKLSVEDFSNEFGDIARIYYDFRKGVLGVSWLINDGEDVEEIMATVPVTEVSNISNIDDLAALEVVEFDSQRFFNSGEALNNAAFIGSK